MSDYRPWDPPAKDEAPEPAAGGAVDPGPDARFSAAPGMAPAEVQTKRRRGWRLSAAYLLGVAGTMLIMGFLTVVAMGFIIDMEELDRGRHDPDLDEVQRLGAWAMVIGIAMAIGPIAMMYGQPWGRGASIATGVVALLPPFTLFGVLALANLGRDA